MEKIKSNIKIIVAGLIAAMCLAFIAGFASMAINNADANDSPVAPVEVNGFSATATGTLSDGTKVTIDLSASGQQASNVPAGVTPLANFFGDNPDVKELTFSISYKDASAVAGQVATLYVQHTNGQTCAPTATFNNAGVVTFTVDGCSIFSLVSQLNQNTSNTSPKTGIFS